MTTVRYPMRVDVPDMLNIFKDWSEEDLVRFIGRRGTHSWVCECNSTAIGMALVQDRDEGELIIERLVGGRWPELLQAVVEYSKKTGRDEVVAYVPESDDRNIWLYKELGFTSKLVRRHFDGEDGIRFSLSAR